MCPAKPKILMMALTQLAGPLRGRAWGRAVRRREGRARWLSALSPRQNRFPGLSSSSPVPQHLSPNHLEPGPSRFCWASCLMRASSGALGPRAGESPRGCAARRCHVESQAACPVGWGRATGRSVGSRLGAAAPAGRLCQTQHSVRPGNPGRGLAGGAARGSPRRARELGLELGLPPPPFLSPRSGCRSPAREKCSREGPGRGNNPRACKDGHVRPRRWRWPGRKPRPALGSE